MPEAKKKKYLVGYWEGAVVPEEAGKAVETLAAEKGIPVLRKLKTGQRVVEMTEEEAWRMAQEKPELVIEEDLELEMYSPMPGLKLRISPETELTLKVTVVEEETKKPVPEATVYCAGKDVTYRGITDQKGLAQVKLHEPALQHVIVSPKDTYWSKLVPSFDVTQAPEITVSLHKLPVAGKYGWGHTDLGLEPLGRRFTGRGVKVAVIDSGLAPHEDLVAAGGYNTLDEEDPAAWNVDEKGHGTHVAGIIDGQANALGITGVAPDAEIYSLKIFPGGKFSDLIEAVNWCVDNYMDVISMSLGAPAPSVQVENALQEAYARGITCIAAAGNDGGPVSFPAALESVIAVAAVGRVGTFPEESAHQLRIGEAFGNDGQTFFAKFSNSGPQISVCAPGVAILSTVPSGYASWDGTSMACPFISGLAALILEAYPEIRTGDAWQPYYVRETLQASCADLGLPAEMQGAGLPNAEAALSTALVQKQYQDEWTKSYQANISALLDTVKGYTSRLEEALASIEKTGPPG